MKLPGRSIMLIQNCDTGQKHFVKYEEKKCISDIVAYLRKEDNIKDVILFTYFSDEKAKSISNKTIVDGNKVYLNEDLTLKEIRDSLEDPALPIYYQTKEIDEAIILKYRTDRYRRVGYDTDILQKKRVVLGGVGILGNEIAYHLGSLGVGSLTAIDYGYVDWYNIYRQPLFTKSNVFKRKVDVVKEKLEDMLKIEVIPVHIEVPCLASESDKKKIFRNLKILCSLVEESNVVIGAFDIRSAREVLQILSKFHNKPYVVSSLDVHGGEIIAYFDSKTTGCYCCGSSKDSGGLIDGGACTLAFIEAQKIISALTTKMILDILLDKPINKNYYEYYPFSLNLDKSKLKGSSGCLVCNNNTLPFMSKPELFEYIYNWLFARKKCIINV